ncbi:hydrogenase maturation protease [Actinoplanes sp. CA-142083]|uniref:hydrogenase maturation protease n=1 Tax=Actinoplanes sp. CA-142083 TaxID=3239903 RepID=UPI003D94E510
MNILVAGIGNIFFGDDGFGPEVVRRLLAEGPPPPQVRIVDYGIRGMFLAFDLLGVDRLILIDALPGEETPGELVVFEIGPDDVEPTGFDAHMMSPGRVLGAVRKLGEALPPTYLVGCRIDTAFEDISLTPRVEKAIPGAMEAVHALIDRMLAEPDDSDPAKSGVYSPVAQIMREVRAEPKGAVRPLKAETPDVWGGG